MPALRYIVEAAKLNEMLALLHRLFDLRITFFDMEAQELDYFDIKPMTPFCRRLRSSPERERACVTCDREHLEVAKGARKAHLYRCHVGLLEGIIPLYDGRGIYLGAVVFGQLRAPEGKPPAGCGRTLAGLYRRLPECSPERMADIARLLEHVTDHLVRSETVRFRNRSWAEELERYIAANLSGRITTGDLAGAIRRSESFVSHLFRTEFGTSPASYVRKRRMEAAREMLKAGEYVGRVAERLGFYDAFHFSKAFKAFYGHPPVKCRASAPVR
ncbi:MAG TPA: PocR ligand-binding domain-containing protein [Planctomycetota bacterium]|nr:PocR ligand-binding domain-containing protein [Planctomycetota bacterium]